MIKIFVVLILLLHFDCEVIAKYDFTNVELNGEIRDNGGTTNSKLITNDMFGKKTNKHSIRLHFNKKETIKSKDKYNFIKNQLMNRNEIKIEITFDAKYSNGERFCLFCLKNDAKYPIRDVCTGYDLAIIKMDKLLQLTFKEPGNPGCYYSTRTVLWKEEYDEEPIQKVLFVYDSFSKRISINGLEVLNFANFNQNGFVVNNWKDDLDLVIGQDRGERLKYKDSFVDIYKVEVFDTKFFENKLEKIEFKEHTIQKWIKGGSNRMCQCGDKVEKSICLCGRNNLENVLSGKCNCKESSGVCRCKSDDKCVIDKKTHVCKEPHKEIGKSLHTTTLEEKCIKRDVQFKWEICFDVFGENDNQYLKDPKLLSGMTLEIEVKDLTGCDPDKLAFNKKCCQSMTVSTLHEQFKHIKTKEYKSFLVFQFTENESNKPIEVKLSNVLKNENGVCKSKKQDSWFKSKLSNGYQIVTHFFEDNLMKKPLQMIKSNQYVYSTIKLYKQVKDELQDVCKLEEDVSLFLKKIFLNVVNSITDTEKESYLLNGLHTTNISRTDCNSQINVNFLISPHYINNEGDKVSFDVSGYMKEHKKKERINYAVKHFRDDRKILNLIHHSKSYLSEFTDNTLRNLLAVFFSIFIVFIAVAFFIYIIFFSGHGNTGVVNVFVFDERKTNYNDKKVIEEEDFINEPTEESENKVMKINFN